LVIITWSTGPSGAASPRPCRIGEVAWAFGANDQRAISAYRESLLDKGFVWSPRRGQVEFTVPLFDDYLRENHPIE